MTEQLDFPPIDEAVQSTSVATAAPAGELDLSKVDITDVALAQFGPWREQVDAATEKLKGVVHDFSTATKLTEGKALRQRLVNVPRSEARKLSTALKSKLTATNRAITAREGEIVAEWDKVEELITPQIDAADAKLEAERAEKARIEQERKDRHATQIAVIRNVVERAKGLPSDRIRAAVAAVDAIEINPAQWDADFIEAGRAAKAETLDQLQDMIAAAEAAEHLAEQQRMERLRLAEERAAFERRQAEVAAEIERQRVEAEKLAAERAEFERQKAELAAAQAEMERRAQVAQQNSERDAREAVERAEAEARREQEAESLDSQQREDAEAQAAKQSEAQHADPSVEIPAETEVAPAIIPVAPPVSQVREPEPDLQVEEEKATLSLGTLNMRLEEDGGMKVTATFLTKLGFPAKSEGAAKLYRESQFGAICSAIADHTHKVATLHRLEKAA